MKCVCPMGGDRTCPDDCPIAIWQVLSPSDRKAQRKPIAARLYRQGFTMEAIATQLGVTNQTISKDLRDFPTELENAPAPSPGRRGRPKGSSSKRTDQALVEKAALAVLDHGLTLQQAMEENGLNSVQVIKTAVAKEEGRRDPNIERNELSATAQQRLDAAMRQYQRKLETELDARVRAEVKRRIDEIVLPHWKKQIADASRLYARRTSLMTKETFNIIRRALHPDSRKSISDERLAAAFDAFMALEKYLLNEVDSPTPFPNLPNTWDEWDAAKRSATHERRAKRPGASVNVH